MEEHLSPELREKTMNNLAQQCQGNECIISRLRFQMINQAVAIMTNSYGQFHEYSKVI